MTSNMESQLRMELYLLRHGESIKNAGQGRGSKSKNGNPGLTENGKKEITRIAKSIRKFKITFDIILTSPLNSAAQTAKGRRSRLVTNGTRVKGIVRPERSIVVKRGGLAKIRIISTTPELRGELRWLLTPRILKSLFEESYTVEKTGQKKGKSGD
jgi:phosphohistidine phosphatase